MTSEQHHLFETSFGVCGIAWSEQGINRLQLPERTRAATERRLRARPSDRGEGTPPTFVRKAIAALERYFAGERVDFSAMTLDLESTGSFHRKIYGATRALGWGQTASYGELAQKVGSPGAARAVGQAMGRNPVPIIVPCHRVLAAGRKIGGFSAPGGAATKQRLLVMEGIHLGTGTPMLPGLLAAGR